MWFGTLAYLGPGQFRSGYDTMTGRRTHFRRVRAKLEPVRELVTPGSERILTFIHIGKCGGSSLMAALRDSPRVRTEFDGVKHVHVRKPVFQRNAIYLIVLRNPVSRALSAFNWRYQLVLEGGEQRDRFRGEADILAKYGTLNTLAESLYDDGALNRTVARDFRRIHHMKEDIDFYLGRLLDRITERQVYAVLTQEHLDEDIRAILGVARPRKTHAFKSKTDPSRLHLSALAKENLRTFLALDYAAIQRLNALHPIGDRKLADLLR